MQKNAWCFIYISIYLGDLKKKTNNHYFDQCSFYADKKGAFCYI